MSDTDLSETNATPVDGPKAERDRAGRFLPGNTAAKTHGIYSEAAKRQAVARLPVDDFEASIVQDLGGEDELTTIQRAYVTSLGDLERVKRMLANHLVEYGLFSKEGRCRSALSKYFEVCDRWDRYARALGMERIAKHVDPMQALQAAIDVAVQKRDGQP